MPYRADVTEPDPNPNIISKYLSEPGLSLQSYKIHQNVY